MAPQSKHIPTPLPFPAKAMLDCGAILGKRGAGKSATARFLFEHEVDIGHRCGFIDPMGDSAGIRLNPDGTPSRFDKIVIFGGPNGDIPITDEDGAKIARIVGTHDISFIIDLSQMIQAEQLRFMAAFADVLFEAIAMPVTLFVDEAHIFAPQERGEAPPKLLNRMARLNSQGRKKGIFLWLMTQRPARINKNILGGTETFIGMKAMMPQDIAAIGDWFDANGPEAAKGARKDLAKLKVGEAFVFASGHDFFQRVQFPFHSTLDTGRTPLHGESSKGVLIPKADIGDLAALFDNMVTGDPRDDEIERLLQENKGLRDIVRDKGTVIDQLGRKVDDVTMREGALIDLMIDLQHRIGGLIGSPRIHPLPAGQLFADFVFVPDSNGDVRPYLRESDNGPHVTAARRRMNAAKAPTRIAPKGKES
jgi:hypothetical protein